MRPLRSPWFLAALPVLPAVLLLACGGDDDGGTQPPTTGTVSGTVTSTAGGGVAGVALSLQRTGSTTRNAQTGADGGYSFTSVETGSWTLTVAEPAGFTLNGSASVAVTVTGGQTTTRDFSLTPDPTTGSIAVSVEADGSARAGVTVRLFTSGGATPIETGTTGNAGVATFGDLAPGGYDVEIEVPTGLVLADGEDDRKPVTVTAGQTAQVSFDLESEQSSIVEVLLNAASFSPADVTIDVGQTIRWRNATPTAHTITPDGHSEWNEQNITQQDQTFQHTFNDAGDFPYECTIHNGMTGIIRVE